MLQFQEVPSTCKLEVWCQLTIAIFLGVTHKSKILFETSIQCLDFNPLSLPLCLFPPLTYNQFHNVLRLFDAFRNFPLTTSETMAITIYKHGIYELPHELSKDLRRKKL